MAQRDEYWVISLQEILGDLGKTFTDEELDYLIDGIKGSMENESMYRGWDCIPNPQDQEIKDLKRNLEKTTHDLEVKLIENDKEWREEYRRLDSDYYVLQQKLERGD